MTLRVGGFPEYNTHDQIIFEDIKKIISQSYKEFGYTSIETSSVEKNNVLLAKTNDELNKQIFGLYGLAQGAKDTKKYSLHFDLTIPFARYTIDNLDNITFPFKRSQIQKVWRGERAQKGRFKEFYQADIDVIWPEKRVKKDNQYIYYDSEVILVLYRTILKVLNYLNLEDKPVVHLNNRKLINGLLNNILDNPDSKDKKQIIHIFDDYYKIGQEKFKLSLEDKGLSSGQIQKILDFTNQDIRLENIKDFKNYIDNKQFKQGIDEIHQTLKNLVNLAKSMDVELKYEIDPFIVRGLDYYTGSVFETFLEKNQDIGSICSGGRYDNLTSHIDKKYKYSGIGGSIGISRFLDYIFDKQDIDLGNKQTCSDYLFINFQKTFDDIIQLAGQFKKENKNIEIYPYQRRIGKQFKYANQKGIPYVVILGEGEKKQNIYKVKNMETGKEKEYKLDI